MIEVSVLSYAWLALYAFLRHPVLPGKHSHYLSSFLFFIFLLVVSKQSRTDRKKKYRLNVKEGQVCWKLDLLAGYTYTWEWNPCFRLWCSDTSLYDTVTIIVVLSRHFGYFREPQKFFCDQLANFGREREERAQKNLLNDHQRVSFKNLFWWLLPDKDG